MTRWIGETVTSDVGWSLLEDLVDVRNRMAGSEGEREGATLTRDALVDVGARNARLEPFDIQGWTRGDSLIESESDSLDCIALPRSPAGTITGTLVDLGYGLPEDVAELDLEGSIAMARSDVPDYYDRYVHRREKYYHALEAGAIGFIYRNHVEGCLPPTGSVGTSEEPIGPIPAVGVSKEVGARLARRYEGESITVTVEADIHDATSQNVHATLGPETDDRVLVTSHVDAHDIAEGALDNAAGTAMVIEIARALATRADELDRRVEFVAYGAEEVGLVGSRHHAETTDTDDIVAVVNNDGVVRGRTLQFFTNGFDDLGALAQSVADRYRHAIEVNPRMAPHSDHWPFVERGVPGYHVMSVTEDVGRGFGHTFADTLDKLDVRDLREQAIVLTDLTVALTDQEVSVPHADTSDIADALEAEKLATSMRVTGDWPFR